jgi:hypothetical protein
MDERRVSMFALTPLWIAMIGGSLTVAAWALDSSVLSLVGVTMFVLDREAIIGSLRALQQESVGQAGRRLARSLGEREYMGESPPTFFARRYELRSSLVHGHYPRPDFGEVGTRAANLEGFVGDLLGAPLLED